MKISIITINRNNATGLASTIKSVLEQTYKDIEYIIIDGDSTDSSKDLIIQHENKLAYWISEPDNGIYHAMNKGIAACTGDYLLFINSGDKLFRKDTVECACNEGLDHDLVYGNLVFVKSKVERCWIPHQKLTFKVFYTSTIPHPATFIKRGLFDQIGFFDESLSIVSDWKFFLLSVCIGNCNYKYINLSIVYFNEDGICSDPANFQRIDDERNSVFKEYFNAFVDDYKELLFVQQEFHRVKRYARIKRKLGFK